MKDFNMRAYIDIVNETHEPAPYVEEPLMQNQDSMEDEVDISEYEYNGPNTGEGADDFEIDVTLPGLGTFHNRPNTLSAQQREHLLSLGVPERALDKIGTYVQYPKTGGDFEMGGW
jgi:hypothetical protein